MSDAALHALAGAAGLLVEWEDADCRRQQVAPESLRRVLAALGYPAANAAQLRDSRARLALELGSPGPLRIVRAGERAVFGEPRATFEWEDERGEVRDGRFDVDGALPFAPAPGYARLRHAGREQAVAVAPPRCFGVADATGGEHARCWGLALQVYSARGPLDGGIGDADGAAAWAGRVAARGGDALALSPVHAVGPVGAHFSPYSPSDRRFLNPLHAAPARVLGEDFARRALERAGLADTFASCSRAQLVDWAHGATIRRRWLRQLHADFASARETLRCDFDTYCTANADSLRAYAAFEAARDGDGEAFHRFAQWLSQRSWADVQAQARANGMRIGLIADLAVGFDPAGAEAAAHADTVLHGLTLGAPPDAFNAQGQSWGIASYHPHALRRAGYAPWIELLRAVMRDRGGVRIDHILGLLRLWVVPQGGESGDGVYLRCPFDDLVDVLALESWRHRCLVIGEDLGVVPEGLRDRLAERGVLGLDVLLFTRDRRGAFLPPARWRRTAVATTTTHDLPPLAGWRVGRDLAWRSRLGLVDDGPLSEELEARQREVERLAAAVAGELGTAGHAHGDWLRFTARSPAPLALLPVEDALALDEQPNLPGTVEVHPNWRRRLPEPLPEDTLARHLDAFAAPRTAEDPR